MTYETKHMAVAICRECGKEFIKKTAKHFYCSKKCGDKAYARSVIKRAKSSDTVYTHKCTYCGKKFETNNIRKYFCSSDCDYLYRYGSKKRIRGQKAENTKTITKKRGRPKFDAQKAQLAKLWDGNDSECKAVMEYLKTVEPIDWAEANRLNEEDRIAKLRAEANEPKTHKGRYVRHNSIIKRCL